jgi:hypothetical protein
LELLQDRFWSNLWYIFFALFCQSFRKYFLLVWCLLVHSLSDVTVLKYPYNLVKFTKHEIQLLFASVYVSFMVTFMWLSFYHAWKWNDGDVTMEINI